MLDLTIKQNKESDWKFHVTLDLGDGRRTAGVLNFGEKEESPVTLFGGKLRHDPYHTGRLQVLRRGDVDSACRYGDDDNVGFLTEDDALMVMALRGTGKYTGGLKY